MPENAVLFSPAIIAVIVLILIIGVALLIEFWRLPRRTLEAYVHGKRHIAESLDPIGTAMMRGEDSYIAGTNVTPEQFIVMVQTNGSDLVMFVEPEMFRAVTVGSTVNVRCSFGRITERLYPERIILPMPKPPSDPALLS